MLEETNKERELFLEKKKLEDIKINRVLEKNFFEEVNTALNYLFDFSSLLEKDEIEKNYILQHSLISNLSNSIQNEIEDNLILLTKEKSEIYLKKLYDKTNATLDRINQELSHFANGQLEAVFDISYNLVKENDYVLYACESISKVKKNRLERLIEVIDINLQYHKNSESQINDKKENQLTANQIVILLDRLGLLAHPDIEDLSRSKQAELISLITGLNKKNLEKYIDKLEASKPTKNYQKDINKIDKILDDLI